MTNNQFLIHKTSDYERFIFAIGNRPLKPRPDLRESMIKNGFLFYCPIICLERNGKLVIIGGQHRFMEARKLGIPVFYTITEENIDIAALERMHKDWKLDDYLHSHALEGKEDYVTLTHYCGKNGIGVSAAASMMIGSVAEASHVSKRLRDGTFRIVRIDIAVAVARIKVATDAYVRWAAHRSYLGALSRCVQIDGFDPNEYIRAMIRNPIMLENWHALIPFIAMVERIYNYHKSNARKLAIRHLVEADFR